MMNTNRFSTPQRQSSIGTVVEWLLLLKKYIKLFAAITFYALLKLPWTEYYWILFVWLLGTLILGYVGYMKYRKLTFYIDEDRREFILEKGIWNKEQLIIQLDKIVQVNVEQHFAQRIVEVYAVSIDTAGSTNSEVHIPALDKSVAMALKSVLMPSNAAMDAGVHNTEVSEHHVSIPFNKLMLHALTADYFRNLLFLAAIAFSFLDKVLNVADTIEQDTNEYENWVLQQWESSSVLLIGIVLLIVPIAFSVLRNMLVYYNMQIRLHAASLTVSYGLLNTKITVINSDRTQVFIRKQHPLQQALGIEKLTITQLSSNIDYDKKAKLQIPGAYPALSTHVFQYLFGVPMPVSHDAVLRPAAMTVVQPIIVYLLIPCILVLGMYYENYLTLNEALWSLLWLPIAVGLIIKYVRGKRFFIKDDVLYIKTAWWNTITKYTLVDKITKVQTKQYPWQVKRNSGTIILNTAGGQFHYITKDYAASIDWLNYWLYKIESKAAAPV